jgi:Na+/glutamate symporter
MNAQHGLYQIDLFYPIDRGTGASIAMVDTVLAAFRRGTTVGTTPVVNIEMSWREAGYSHQQFYCVPITVRWTAYVQN